MKNCHILIIGGGLGGLAAAAALQHFGIRVSIFEQAPALREVGAGVIITPQAMHALNFLGIGPRVMADAGVGDIYRIKKHDTGEVIRVGPRPEQIAERFGATAHQVHRADLLDALAEHVTANDPDCVHLDHRFASLVQDGRSVTARFENGESYTGDALVGCDGGGSRVRAEVFGAGPANYIEQVAFRALMPMDKVPEEQQQHAYTLFIGPERLFLHYPLRNRTIMNVIGIAHEPRWQDEGWTIPATIREFRDLYGDFYPGVHEMIENLTPSQLFKWGLRDREPLEQWTRGRVSMLGDAAHPMTPFLGQGACIAIEDGVVLARAMAQAATIEEAFAVYEATRKERANGVQLASREQGRNLQGRVSEGANEGRVAEDRGLFDYNPVTVKLERPGVSADI